MVLSPGWFDVLYLAFVAGVILMITGIIISTWRR